MDNGQINGYGAVIDNVGVYPWKLNDVQYKEVRAVASGHHVSASSFYDKKHWNYQINAAGHGQYPCWCPINLCSVG